MDPAGSVYRPISGPKNHREGDFEACSLLSTSASPDCRATEEVSRGVKAAIDLREGTDINIGGIHHNLGTSVRPQRPWLGSDHLRTARQRMCGGCPRGSTSKHGPLGNSACVVGMLDLSTASPGPMAIGRGSEA